jgi:soluble lytic murein transglycosylase-like protein
MRSLTALLLALLAPLSFAGNQQYEPLAVDVQMELSSAVNDETSPYLAFNPDGATPYIAFSSVEEARAWLDPMSKKLEGRMPVRRAREEFLLTTHYEATRAGLDPQLVLALIQVESNFRKYAVSSAGARGYMQVMPFWTKLIGQSSHNLFHLRLNLRYGCVILKHYLKIEKGDLFRALGRYNGSLGQAEYPNLVMHAWNSNWKYPVRAQAAGSVPNS